MKGKEIIHKAFKATIFTKAVYSILEITGSIILYFISANTLSKWISYIFSHEISQEPTDFIASHLIFSTQNISTNAKLFASIYLLIHGIVNLVIFISLWKNKYSAYPIITLILSILAAFQVYKLLNHFSYFLFFLTIIDVIIIFLIRFEYKNQKNKY